VGWDEDEPVGGGQMRVQGRREVLGSLLVIGGLLLPVPTRGWGKPKLSVSPTPHVRGGTGISVRYDQARGLWVGASLRFGTRIEDLAPKGPLTSAEGSTTFVVDYTSFEYRVSLWEGYDGGKMTGTRLADTNWGKYDASTW
jgi:hypothetical protein